MVPVAQQQTGHISEIAPEVADTPENGLGEPKQQIESSWPIQSIFLLIESYRQHQHWFSDNKRRKYDVWKDIAKDLQQKGYNVDGQSCDAKMRALKRRYKIIKDNRSLSGRDAEKQWKFYSAMDELLGRDPSITPASLEATLPISSTSHITQQQQHKASLSKIPPGAPSPSNSSSVSPDTSPAMSPTESGGDLTMLPPSEKRPRKHQALETKAHAEHKYLESIARASHERSSLLTVLVDNISKQQLSRSDIHKEKHDSHQKIEGLQERLFQQQQERYKEVTELQRQHHEQLKEQQQKHQQEIREMLRQHQQEIREMQQQRQQEIREMQQQHQREVREQQERFFTVQQQHQKQLLQMMLRSDENK